MKTEKNEESKRSCHCAPLSCPRPHKPTPPVCQTVGLQRAQGHSSHHPLHRQLHSFNHSRRRAISDGYDEGGFKQSPGVEAYLESFKSVGSKTLAELISKFSDSASPVNCVVYDSLLPWALDVARKFGIYAAVFLTNSASVCSMYWHINLGHLTLPVKQETEPLLLPGLPSLAISDMPGFLANPSSHSAYLAVIMEKFGRLEENDWVFCNSSEVLESEVSLLCFILRAFMFNSTTYYIW
jgi:hypothetical protein